MAGQQIKVLIVDDTTHVRRMLRTMLEVDGFEVVAEAASGTEAIDLTDLHDPTVVVMDYKMPDMDGIATASQICERRPEQVIILYTAFADAEIEQRARQVGVTLVLNKVEGLESLEREISRLCGSLF